MTLLDDLVLTTCVGISTACVAIMVVFLTRYRAIVNEASKSSQLAKNIWDALNSRLSVMDARIIDTMAKVEIYAVQQESRRSRKVEDDQLAPRPSVTGKLEPVISPQTQLKAANPVQLNVQVEPQGIERRILSSLSEGPRTNADIKNLVNRSREHTARVMKLLFESGLVARNDRTRPFVYEITDAGRRYLEGT